MTDHPSYDPNLRRDTPLALKLKEWIKETGPLSVADYMNACLQDNEFGYYKTNRAIGASGDFVTAPEISQVFGELIGLWCVAYWQQLGSPDKVHLIELGPGRGTMMRDALRAAKVVRSFHDALCVNLVETNPRLAAIQHKTLDGSCQRMNQYNNFNDLTHYYDMNRTIEPRRLRRQRGPAFVLGNEIIDVLPIRQLQFNGGDWHHRKVGLTDSGNLTWVLGNQSFVTVPEFTRSVKEGDIFEFTFVHKSFANDMASLRDVYAKIGCLFIDYGHTEPALGDTLQAVRGHKFESIFASPGEADLTAQVDFQSVAAAATKAGLAVDGPITQAEFLGSLGIMERASQLMAANPARANEIEMGVARLMAPNGMGTRFKAIGIRSPELPPLPGFPAK
jgi:NADH dehydrogenase [ubiquinone] 1 alpha subcomplex assembly factor 7